MNRAIIERHNSRVKPGDIVFHLGDFKISSDGPTSKELFSMLNGHHVHIKGNHDKNNGSNTPLKYCIIEAFGMNIVLTHKPEDAEVYMAGGGIDMAFVGHVHEKWKFNGKMINVGVDQWDYYPVDIKQIMKAYKKWRLW
jgi:calcineurin-like phosphoesterase family protein